MRRIHLMSDDEQKSINPHLLDIVSYRKSGLSLNHIIGCSLDCAYCVRHFFDNFEMKRPQMLCTDEEAIDLLVRHKYFIPNVTPIQIFNRATDPFLPAVKAHTFHVLRILDSLGLTNQVLVITRSKVLKEDVEQLELLENVKLNLLVTYSGISDTRIEPVAGNSTTTDSIRTIGKYKLKTKLILYWRPIVAGWNDDSESFARVLDVAQCVDAIVYTGYYHRPENFEYLKSIGLDIQYGNFERRKFLSKELETRVLNAYKESGLNIPLFKKTSCGVAYVQQSPDYNGHWGANELCDICPKQQRELCANAYKTPSRDEFQTLLEKYCYDTPFIIDDGHIWTHGLGEERRYHLQHTLGYQIWDIDLPHFRDQHGRSSFGQPLSAFDIESYEDIKGRFLNDLKENDD